MGASLSSLGAYTASFAHDAGLTPSNLFHRTYEYIKHHANTSEHAQSIVGIKPPKDIHQDLDEKIDTLRNTKTSPNNQVETLSETPNPQEAVPQTVSTPTEVDLENALSVSAHKGEGMGQMILDLRNSSGFKELPEHIRRGQKRRSVYF